MAFGQDAYAGGQASFAANSGTASDVFACAVNGGTASGDSAFASGSGTASGDGASAHGALTTASGDYSHAEGWSTVASGTASHAAGKGATASHDYSFVWSDGAATASSATKEFTVYAENGIRLLGGEISGNGAGITNLNLDAMAWLTNAVTYTADAITLDGTARNITINPTNSTTITLDGSYPHGRDLAITYNGTNALTWPVEYTMLSSVSGITLTGTNVFATMYQGGTNYNVIGVAQ